MLKLFFLFLVVLLLRTIKTAPVDFDDDDARTESTTILSQSDARDAGTTSSPIHQWFDNLTKNQTNVPNSLQDLQKWFANLSGNSDTNNPFGNILGGNQPIMILGSYQAVKIPLPQITDILKNFHNFNQLLQGNIGKLPQLLKQ